MGLQMLQLWVSKRAWTPALTTQHAHHSLHSPVALPL